MMEWLMRHDQVEVENFSALTLALTLLLPHYSLSADRQALFHNSKNFFFRFCQFTLSGFPEVFHAKR
jgi:hypothetical protein